MQHSISLVELVQHLFAPHRQTRIVDRGALEAQGPKLGSTPCGADMFESVDVIFSNGDTLLHSTLPEARMVSST